jgi:hypothetical protein
MTDDDYKSPPLPIVAEVLVHYTIGEPMKPRPVDWEEQD